MARILVVEDERKINDIIRDYLHSLDHSVTQCFTALEAIQYNSMESFDLVVLDLMLPGMDGIEAARRLREHSDIPIIMLTARDSEGDKLLGLEVGADDYMTKPFSVRELGARIRAVLRRYTTPGSETDTTTIIHYDITLDPSKRTVRKGDQSIKLTSAQFELLRILLQSPGRVYTRADLIEKLNSYAYEGYERTIDVHIKNLRKVIEDNPAEPNLLLTVWGVGYKAAE